MQNTFNPEPKAIKLTREELAELWQFLMKCDKEGFTGPNNYARMAVEREYMYQWHLREIAKKVFLLAFKVIERQDRHNFTIKVSEIEQRTLSVLFKRVDCSPFMLQLQQRFINQLEKLR